MRIGLLGPVVAERRDGTSVRLGGPKQKAVLVLLALHPRALVSSEALCDAIWGESLPPRPHRTLSVYVSTLRAALGESSTGRASGPLQTVPGGYLLDVGDNDIDLGRFRGAVATARPALARGRPRFARDRLAAALSECRGVPMEDLLGLPFAAEIYASLVEEELDARELLTQADLDLGRPREVIGELRRLTQAHPLRERFWGQLMLALYLDGRQAQALETYAHVRQVMLEETGLDPHPDLVDLERRILAQDDSLRPRPPRIHVGALPRPLTDLIGREPLVADVIARLRDPDTRLLTLTGPGGAGKTHLALEVAHRLEGDTTNVRFMDCTSAQDYAGLLTRLADCLGLDPYDELADVDKLRDAVTVVADNLEQVSIDAGRLLGSLLERAPAVTVLATSRVRLSCRGERVLTVPPLDTGAARVPTGGAALVEIPAAVEMFVSRVNSAFPGVRLDDQLDDVRELCRTLGGLPLAIELAAAQARTVTPRQYRARIQALLTSNAPKGSAGETLRASIEASLRLVPTLAREKFPLLAVFSGGFTLEAVEAVCVDFGDATDPAVWLADLVDASLVCPVESPAGRRFMLLEPLRIAVAMSPPSPAVASAHARHFISVGHEAIRRLQTSGEGDMEPLLKADAANWAQALGWAATTDTDLAVELLDSWMSLWCTAMFALPIAGDAFETLHVAIRTMSPVTAARFRVLRGGYSYLSGEPREAMEALSDAAPELERVANDPRLVSRGYCWLAAASCTIGEADIARAAARESRRIADASGIAQLMAVAWDLSAFVAVSLHDLADAEAAVDRSIALAEQAGDEIARGFALSTQGDLLVEQGRDHELGAVAEEILQVARGTEAPEALELTGLRFLALAELHDGRPAAAGAVLAEAIPRWADAHLDLNVLDGLFIAAAVLTAARDLAVSGASGHIPDRATSVQLVHDLDRLAAADGIDPDTLPRMARERLAPLQSNTAPLVGFGTRPGIDKRSFRSALTQRVLNMLAELSPTTSSH